MEKHILLRAKQIEAQIDMLKGVLDSYSASPSYFKNIYFNKSGEDEEVAHKISSSIIRDHALICEDIRNIIDELEIKFEKL